MSHVTVCTEGEDDAHVLISDAKFIELIDENRHEVKAVGHTCWVIADECDGVAGLDNLVDSLTPDWIVDGIQHALLDVLHDRELLCTHFLENESIVDCELLAASAVGKIKLLDRHVFSSPLRCELFLYACSQIWVRDAYEKLHESNYYKKCNLVIVLMLCTEAAIIYRGQKCGVF